MDHKRNNYQLMLITLICPPQNVSMRYNKTEFITDGI